MSQLSLAWDAAHAGAEIWESKLAWLRRAVDVIGHKEVAYKLDVQPSQLTDALLERERKDVKAKWFDTVLFMVPEEMRAEYLRIASNALDYQAPKRIEPMTPAQKNRKAREWLKEHAPAVLEMMDREVGL